MPRPRDDKRRHREQRAARAPEPVNATKRWQKNRNVTIFVAVFTVMSVLAILFRFAYVSLTVPVVSTEIIRSGSVESPRTITGVIIREEQVYTAEREGQLQFNVSDHERVKPGTLVASIQNRDAVNDINRDMERIEEEIMEFHRSFRQDISTVDPAVQRINGQLKNIIDGRVHHFTALSVNEVYNLQESLTQMISTRNQMISEDNRAAREELAQEQQNLINRLSIHSAPIRAEQSGIMSRMVDGLEERLTVENMGDLTREETLFSVNYDELIPARDVSVGDPVFKLVTSNIWYIAAYFPNDLVEGFAENQTRTIYIENNGEYVPVSVRIERLDNNYNDSFLLFRCNRNMIDFLNTRTVRIRTAETVRTGLKISASAIVTRDFFAVPHTYIFSSERERYVLKAVGDTTLMVPVNVIDSDEYYAYIPLETENLRLHDTLVGAGHITRLSELPNSGSEPAEGREAGTLSPGDSYVLSELLTFQGVFRANKGYAEFITITPDEFSGSGSFIILNPMLNPRLREFDQIVFNASDVRDGQIL